MKRINIIFTAINIFIIAVMLIQIGIAYAGATQHHLSAPPAVVFAFAILYIPPLILINIIWRVVRRKKAGELPPEETPVSNFLTREDALRWLVNIIAVALNILIIVIMLIHNTNEMRNYTGLTFWDKFWDELFGMTCIYGIIPFVLVNDAWVVIRMNLKKAN